MDTSRVAAQTVPEELQRQSVRVNEQIAKLNIILDTTIDHLTRMSKIMENYSPDLVKQINTLAKSVTEYRTKAGKIYGEISESLLNYATNLLHNLENLTASVGNIVTSVQDL